MSERAPLVKICCVTRAEDAVIALDAGADFIGAMLTPGLTRSVAPELAATYARGDTPLVGVFVDQRAKEIVSSARTAGVDILQLHGDETPPLFPVLRSEGPWKLWKAVRIVERDDVMSAVDRWADLVDGLLFDGPRQGSVGGKPFSWDALEAVREAIPVSLPVIVAGGLRPTNVADAISRTIPDVVDVSSGVEVTPGRKDAALVRAFVDAARRGEWLPSEEESVGGSSRRTP